MGSGTYLGVVRHIDARIIVIEDEYFQEHEWDLGRGTVMPDLAVEAGDEVEVDVEFEYYTVEAIRHTTLSPRALDARITEIEKRLGIE